jgi:drug/metabolite transporter (DMT)-like permease
MGAGPAFTLPGMTSPVAASAVSEQAAPVRPRFALSGRDLVLYAVLVFCWGTSWLGMKWQIGVVAPEVSIVWRFMAAAPIMMLWAALRGESLRRTAREHMGFALLGVLMFSTNFVFAYHGAAHLTSGLVSVVFSLASIVNILLGALLLRQAINPRVALGALIGFGGICLLFAPELTARGAAGLDQNVLIGLAISFGATFCFCLGNMVSAAMQRRSIPVVPATAWGMVYGTIWAAILAFAQGAPFTIDFSVRYLGSLAFLVVSATVVAFFAYLTLLGRIGPARAGYATVLFPIVALIISSVAENYHWTWLAALGLVLVMTGNVLVLTRRG